MGRKKRRAHKSEPVEEVENSIVNSDSEGEIVDTTTDSPEERLRIAIDMLTEKGRSTRMEGLSTIKHLLQHNDPTAVFDQHTSNSALLEAVTSCLRRGRKDEAVLAAEVLALAGLWMSVDAEELVDGHGLASTSTATALAALHSAAAHSSGRPDAVRAAAFVALGVWHFGCPETESVTEEALEFVEMQGLIESNSSSVVAAAMRSWVMLMSVLPEAQRAQRLHSMQDRLVEMMESLDSCMVEEAGWGVGLLGEASWTESGGGGGVPTEVLAAVEDRAKESSKAKSRRQRSAQRALFRDVQTTVESGEETEGETVVVEGHRLVLLSWEKRVRMRYVRLLVGGGLPIFLRNNVLVQGALGIDFDLSSAAPSLSKAEKKAFLSANSEYAKQRTIARQTSRRNTAALPFGDTL